MKIVVDLIIVVAVLVAGFGLYIGAIFLGAWFEMRTLPRSEVFLCDKHGPMQKESTISFMGIPYCPICFHERLSSQEKIR